ncbi:MAG TPA: DUF4835 family protein [Chitinophagales bacterium]|nr:DUF4835 family protein [Chitinophagales bacterium]
MNKIYRIAFSFLLITVLAHTSSAQGELKCQLTVNAQRVVGVDPSVFQTMQTALSEFMNNKSWTNDQFAPEERIECSMFINIDGSSAQDVYNASITVQLSRPVFNSSYSSPMFNFIDKDCILTYAQNQPLDFNVNQYQSNLTSILGFYAYVLIGLDYETMSKGGGTKYFTMAEQVLNNVPTNSPDSKGWKPFDSQRNRYWLINSLQASKYEQFRVALYEYHFKGMDNFYEKPALARQNILSALDKLSKIARENPNNMLLAVFFQAKSDEVVNVFSGADMTEKAKALTVLRIADPSNSAKYDKLIKN